MDELRDQLQTLAQKKKALQRRRQLLADSGATTKFLDKIISTTDRKRYAIARELAKCQDSATGH